MHSFQVFTHETGGEQPRGDRTSAFMCAFRLVSGTKTWSANQHSPASIGTHIRDNNNRINHAHAGINVPRRRWLTVGSVSSLGSTLVHWFEGLRWITQPGFRTVKLGRGVKVEKAHKHEAETRCLAFSPVSCPRLNTVKLDKEENCTWSVVSWSLCCD